MKTKAFFLGTLASLILLTAYFTILSLVSGLSFAKYQFSQFWYFVVALAVGFGIQVGLYTYLKTIVKKMSPRVVAATGVASTAAMITCCAHYLANILPVLGVIGVITFVSQYQTELFWVGLVFNFAGIVYMTNKVVKARKHT